MFAFWTEIVELVAAGLMLAAALRFKKNNSPCRQPTFVQLGLQGNQHVIASKLPKNFGQSRIEVR